MDPERARIEADLRGIVEGEVRCDDIFLQMYASDASVYEIKPLGVVRPRRLSDVVACVKYGSENQIPIHARGAGTGLAGESLGPGLILDFAHSMRRVLSIDEETVRVQPGVIHMQLNRQLKPHGKLFGPDPATRSVTTMGSVLALDASGSHWPRYGSARHHVVEMQAVLADGEVIQAGRHSTTGGSDSETNTRRGQIVKQVSRLMQENAALIEQYRPKSKVNRLGYNVFDSLENGQLNLAKLLVGSEGTLALTTEATVHIEPIARHRGVVLLFFDRLDAAARGALEVADLDSVACDLMDRRLLSIARDLDVRFDLLIPQRTEALLLVELQDDDEQLLRDRLNQIVQRIQRKRRLAFDFRMTMDREERDLYWRLARRVIPTLYRLKGTTRALPFVEDVAVPPEKLPAFLVELQNVLKTHRVTASLFAHAGHGQLHIRPFLDLANPDDVRRMEELANDLYAEVLAIGGTLSGEHGAGLSRTCYMKKQYGPLCDLFRAIKQIFDPQNTFNPGKVVPDQPRGPTEQLRPVLVSRTENSGSSDGDSQVDTDGKVESRAVADVVKLQLNWSHDEVALAARSCNGCGRCRTLAPEERMCPIFRFAPSEEASPRAKANLMRGILTGRLAAEELQGEQLKSVADLCVNCHQCRLECPASVDIPRLMMECKGQFFASNGARPSDWLLSHPDFVAYWASLVRPFSNWAIGNRVARWFIEKIFGVAQGRKLPRFTSRSFVRMAHRRRLDRPTRRTGRKVLYFHDSFVNWHDPELGDALVAILEHNGVAVYVDPRQQNSGMAFVSDGAIDAARKVAKKNVKLLADAVRQGYHIVASEPSAALCLKHEYLALLDDDDSRLVADNSSEACRYLWRMHESGNLELDFKPINATLGYHQPCHLRALGSGSPGENLLRLIPGLTVQHVERGCSGMAGIFGFKRKNYRSSLRAGWGLISAMRELNISAGTTECSACKIQMEQGTSKPTIHPLKLLALSYGLMPQLESVLGTRSGELIVT